MSISFQIHNVKNIKAAAYNGKFGSSWINLYIKTDENTEEITFFLDSYAVAVAYALAINNAPDVAFANMVHQREAAE